MHLWPSQRIRDSFKESYLSKMEWNLHRMKKQSKASSADQNLKLPLLSSESRKDTDDPNKSVAGTEYSDLLPSTKLTASLLDLSQDLVLILTCCACCLCFGVAASQDEEEQ